MSRIISCSPENIQNLSKIIANGGIIIFPTDTVYGIGCNPYDKKAVKKIYRIKQRDQTKPFPILGFSKKCIEQIAEFDNRANIIAKKFWPGKITLVLKLKDSKLKSSLGIKQKIAVRVPNHKCTLSILEKCELLVGTSANKSGISSFTDSKECARNMDDYDIFVDDGVIKSEGESTIVDTTGKDLVILREGAIKESEIKSIV